MNWSFSNDRPIYAQLVDTISKRILTGYYPLGSQVPSVRMLAQEANVNPNTMQKAMVDLESQGLIHTERTSGKQVTTDSSLLSGLKKQLAASYTEQFLADMQGIGIDRADVADILSKQVKGDNKTALKAIADIADKQF